jgi:hypothetical protein
MFGFGFGSTEGEIEEDDTPVQIAHGCVHAVITSR